jgi:hypothetical protein
MLETKIYRPETKTDRPETGTISQNQRYSLKTRDRENKRKYTYLQSKVLESPKAKAKYTGGCTVHQRQRTEIYSQRQGHI